MQNTDDVATTDCAHRGSAEREFLTRLVAEEPDEQVRHAEQAESVQHGYAIEATLKSLGLAPTACRCPVCDAPVFRLQSHPSVMISQRHGGQHTCPVGAVRH